MESSQVKAIFVGVTYEHMVTGGVTPLDRIPYIYAKKFMENLVFKGAFTPEQCELLTDWDKKFKAPSKQNVTKALTGMIMNAKEGDSLLFYFCGHGVAYQDPDTKAFIQRDGHWGSLKTLKEADKSKYLVDEFFDTEFQGIIDGLAPNVKLSMFIHACHGGVMFVAPGQEPSAYNGKGTALSAVDPTIPVAIENPSNTDFSTRRDFTVFLIENVMKKYKGEWPPRYTEVQDILVECADSAKKQRPVLYHGPGINPSELRFP